MLALVDVARETISSLHYAVLQTVLAILIVDAFHKWVGKDLIRLAQFHEFLERLSFLLARAAHWMVLKG